MIEGRTYARLLLLVALAATAVVYLPGLGGPFIFDDVPNITANPFIPMSTLDWQSVRNSVFANQSGIFYRPIASLSFSLNYFAAGGFDATAFKLTNLLLHTFNGCLVYLLAARIRERLAAAGGRPPATGSRDWVPAAIAALWLLHPLQLTSVLYVVQRMNSLSALFTLAGLLLVLAGRTRLEKGTPGGPAMMYAGVVGGVGLGVLCKENAALLPVYALVLELCCFRARALNAARRRRLVVFYAMVLGVPAVGAAVYVLINPEFILGPYVSRSFTLTERVLTQPRVLFYYVGLIFFPTRNSLGLFHDDFELSTGLLEPVTTVFAILGWAGVIALAVAFRRRAPVLFLGVGFYLAGHLMESTVLGLEMVHEHRNYLPMFGLLFLAVHALVGLFERVEARRSVVYSVLALSVLTLGFVTATRAHTWSSRATLLEAQVRHHPGSPRAHGFYAEEIINRRGDIFEAYRHMQHYARLSPTTITGLAEMVRIANGFRLTDVERSPDPGPAVPGVGLFELPLVNHPERLEHIAREAGAEIERRLRTYPVPANAVKTFVDLQNCLYEGSKVCVDLAPDMLRWMEIALDNPRLVPFFRAILLMTTAKTHSWIGNLDRAVDYAERSVSILPDDVNLSVELIRLYLALGEVDRGLEALERIRRLSGATGFRADTLRDLETQLRSAES